MARGAAWLVAGALLLGASLPARAAEKRDAELSPRERMAVQKFFTLKAWDVDDLIKAGRYEKALALADAMITLLPGEGGRDFLRVLKNRAREGIQASRVVRGELLEPAAFTEVGDPLVFRIAVTNVGERPLEIVMDAEDGNQGASRLHVECEEQGCLGGVAHTAWDIPIPGLDGRRVLDPGASLRTRAVLDTADRSPLNPTVRVYRVSGWIRPFEMRAGTRPATRPIRLETKTVRVFPRGLGPLRRAPFETMQEGIEEAFAPKIVLAAHFIGPRRRRAAAMALVEGQRRETSDPALPRVMRVALRALLKRWDLPLERDAWKRWWFENGEDVNQRLREEQKAHERGAGPVGTGGEKGKK